MEAKVIKSADLFNEEIAKCYTKILNTIIQAKTLKQVKSDLFSLFYEQKDISKLIIKYFDIIINVYTISIYQRANENTTSEKDTIIITI